MEEQVRENNELAKNIKPMAYTNRISLLLFTKLKKCGNQELDFMNKFSNTEIIDVLLNQEQIMIV